MMRTDLHAIEYDMVLPHQLRATLKPRKYQVPSLLVRQMERQVTKSCWTGIIALGINAALKIRGKPEVDSETKRQLYRVMIDDLVTKEP